MRNMQNTIWFSIFVGIVQYAAAILIAIGGFLFALTCFAWAIRVYDMLKEQCNLEKLLDTPQKSKERDTSEVNTTYCYPQDEGPLTRICPLCGALYPSFKVICEEDEHILQPFRKPTTEPLQANVKRNDLAQEINEAERLFEEELDGIRTELEEKACQYGNYRHAYSFSKEETQRLYNLYNSVREQSHEEGKKAS